MKFLALLGLLAVGFGLRLFLAWHYDRSFDLLSYDLVADILRHGGNVYAETTRYNYSPVWFLCLGGLDALAGVVGLPFHFVIRAALTLADAATAWVLYLLARSAGLPAWRAVLCFVLNPVSIVVTGFHAQFENVAILFLLLALLAQERRATGAAWALASFGVLVKHIVVFVPLYLLNRVFPRPEVRAGAWALTCAVFLLSFVPYAGTGWHGIRENVFGYGSLPFIYGITALPGYKHVLAQVGPLVPQALKGLMVGTLVLGGLLASRTPPLQAALLPMLIFLALTPGFGSQYLVLPVALGALRPSWGFLAYSCCATWIMLGSEYELFLEPFKGPWSARFLLLTWLAVLAWLAWEVKTARSPRPA